MANATLRERQTQYKSCPQELYKLNAQQLIRKMPKTLEDVTDSGSHICALDKG
jgi:hypothetical protein